MRKAVKQSSEICKTERAARLVAPASVPSVPGWAALTAHGRIGNQSLQRLLVKAGGNPLPDSVRHFFEPRLNHDFSKVRVHTDNKAAESARNINARAFTHGTDVTFGAGQYAPETTNGKRLLAHELAHVVQQSRRGSNNPPAGMVQRTVSFDVQDWEGTKSDPMPTPRNWTNDPAFIEIPRSGQIAIIPTVQVNGDAGDNCAGFEVGTTQTAWIAWTIGEYRGQNAGDGSIRVRHRATMPMRDPGDNGNIFYDNTIVRSPGACGESVDILQNDSPWHAIPKMRNNGAVSGNPLNYLRGYSRGLHIVTYLTARDPSGNFLSKPLRFMYWNSLQDFRFTPNFASPSATWDHTGQIRVNIGAAGRGDTTDAPYFTTPGATYADHFNDAANWDVDERK
jgi:hypothetical protein